MDVCHRPFGSSLGLARIIIFSLAQYNKITMCGSLVLCKNLVTLFQILAKF